MHDHLDAVTTSTSYRPIDSETPTPRLSAESTLSQNAFTADSASFMTSDHGTKDSTKLLPPFAQNEERPSRLSRNIRRLSISPSPHRARSSPPPPPPLTTKEKVTWMSLPHKSQLLILLFARLAEPLTNTSLQSYLYYQLSFFSPSLPPSRIAAQAGIVSAAFSAAQAVTSVFWGSVADSPRFGRKFVIIIGLCGTGVGALGYGFAEDWIMATACRALSGALNGNVGVMRTMISEIVKEKKYQSRAFLLMPFCFNVGVIIGPILGGLLADPIGSYPVLFGPGGRFGGIDGVWWLKIWSYSLPNILSATYLFGTAVLVFFFLEETHDALKDKPDVGIRVGLSVKHFLQRMFGRRDHSYTTLPSADLETPIYAADNPSQTTAAIEMYPTTPSLPQASLSTKANSAPYVLPLRKLFTRSVLTLLTSHFLMAMGVGTYNALWFLFLSTPRFDPSHPIPPSHTQQSAPFHFTGGLGLPPKSVGLATAVIGVIGITLQLTLYPPVSSYLGTLRSYQLALCLFPLVYFVTPYLALIHSSRPAPEPASGIAVWGGIFAVLAMQVLARTFALPAQIILINNAAPHKSRLGTLHGVAQSVSSAARTAGPVFWAWLLGEGLRRGVVGLAYWGMAIMAVVGAGVSWCVNEGEGGDS